LEYLKRAYQWMFGGLRTLLTFSWRKSESDELDEESEAEPVEEKDYTPSIDVSPEQAELDLGPITEKKKAGRGKATIKRLAEPVQIKSFEYKYPGLDLLLTNPNPGTAVGAEELQMTARMLQETLETFGIKIEGPIERFPGPVITRYEFKPAAGIKVNQIIGLSDDLALALKAKRIRIIAPIPGKAAVGVEIPNRNPQTVYARDIFETEEFNNPAIRLPLAMGKNTAGKPFVADLTKMPHLLIAGATGSGKSVCMNMLITSLLYRLHPHQVRFVFIDPKMLELSVYAGIPHLGRPVVTKPKGAEKVLSDIVNEMESRYRRFAAASVRNIEDYNRRQPTEETKQPYIVVFVDELADLMMSSTSSRTEMLITRLAQMARAVGIHLILATQRPSVDVITGLIKANFPARVAFQVASKVDSRTIIDGNGAEKLLGSGDMLFLSTGQPEPQRVHGAYISSEETERIVTFINEQGIPMLALEGISQSSEDSSEGEIDTGDPLFREACEVVIRHKQGSVSLLQRRLGIGYQRAARLIDKLEQAGVVSPFDGSKAREVVVDKSFLDSLGAARPSRQPAGDAQ
ncbi:MAG: DNA translocase FtsK, partial [candidate division Zixibacteria bacterium]|nr:DNA translocase FtsK [candidate division Zixibacteria bacterium]